MSGFREKAIFVWHPELIAGGDPGMTAHLLAQAGFEAAYLHTTDGYGIPTSDGRERFGMALVSALKAAGLTVYGWGAVYGLDVEREAILAADQVRRFGLAGHIFDAETGWESRTVDGVKVLRPEAAANTRRLLTRFRQMAPTAPTAWCWWPLIYAPISKSPYHPAAILQAAMETADVGMPMAYWSWGDDPANAVRYLDEVWSQWRKYTSKPLVIAGRACTGDGGTARPDAVLAFEARARALGAVGMTWWDMWHALDESVVPGVWGALSRTPKMGQQEPDPGIPEGGNMWNKNAIGYHAKKITDAGWDNPEFNFFMLQGGRGVEEPNPDLKPMELKAREQKKVVLINYDFSPAYYLGQQYPYGDPAKWPHFEMDWPLRKFVEMLANRSPDGVVISLLDGSDQDGKPATANWVSYAGREFITRAKKWLETNKPGLPVFIRTSHKWLKQNGAPALEWIHQHETLVEQPADEPLALDKAFPPDGSKPAYVGASTGWTFWKYHAFLILFNGSPTALAARFGASAQPEADTTPPGVPGGLGAITTADAVYLTWNAVGDAAGYHVWCDGQRVATVVTTAWSDLDLGPGSYTYQVEAFDAAGNISAKSAGLVATVSGGSSPQPVDLKPVMDMLERLEAGQAALAAAQQNLLAAVASTAKAVDEIRAHFKP